MDRDFKSKNKQNNPGNPGIHFDFEKQPRTPPLNLKTFQEYDRIRLEINHQKLCTSSFTPSPLPTPLQELPMAEPSVLPVNIPWWQ